MSKSFRYVPDFDFPADKGFTGSAGKQYVKGYCRGGATKMAIGGSVKEAVHKHEKIMHPGEPLTKLASGGKVGKVMTEFKEGKLRSGGDRVVTTPKQAIAIALSEAKRKA